MSETLWFTLFLRAEATRLDVMTAIELASQRGWRWRSPGEGGIQLSLPDGELRVAREDSEALDGIAGGAGVTLWRDATDIELWVSGLRAALAVDMTHLRESDPDAPARVEGLVDLFGALASALQARFGFAADEEMIEGMATRFPHLAKVLNDDSATFGTPPAAAFWLTWLASDGPPASFVHGLQAQYSAGTVTRCCLYPWHVTSATLLDETSRLH